MKIQIPDSDVHVVSDWAELFVLSLNSPLSKQELSNFIKANLPELKDFERSTLADSTFNELQYRSKTLYGASCHYEVDGNQVKPLMKLSDFPEIALCLIFALKGVIVQKGQNNGTKYFEQISNVASESFVGNSRLVGFPSDANLNSQIQEVCDLCFELKGYENPKSSDKDGGVDMIAWRDFNDERSNKIVVLIQSGAGKHFSRKKSINTKKWNRWVRWSFAPLTAMTTPRVIRDSDEWQELADYYEIIFDRPRIVRSIHSAKNLNAALRKEIEKWCLSNIN